MLDKHFKKESPILGLLGGGGGIGSKLIGGGGGSVSASGGDLNAETTPDGNTYHVFYNPGTLTVSGAGDVDILLVAGGASGRGGHGPVGAGGQVVLYESETLTAGSYPINIGTGGAASPPQGINSGNNTTGFSYTAYGAGQDPALPPNIPGSFPGFTAQWGPGPGYGNVNSPSFGSPGPNAGVGAAGVGGSVDGQNGLNGQTGTGRGGYGGGPTVSRGDRGLAQGQNGGAGGGGAFGGGGGCAGHLGSPNCGGGGGGGLCYIVYGLNAPSGY